MKEAALIIFIKNPELGKAKTRLAKSVGDKEALEIYKILLNHTRDTTINLDQDIFLYYSNFIDDHDDWPSEKYHKKLQRGVDLGERMMDAFVDILSFYKKVVIIGSDCIALEKKHIIQAFDQLDHNEVVLGPSLDGGYYLMGLKKSHIPLFIGIPWSSGNEYSLTRQRALSNGLKLFNLEPLNDIDTIADWQAHLDQL